MPVDQVHPEIEHTSLQFGNEGDIRQMEDKSMQNDLTNEDQQSKRYGDLTLWGLLAAMFCSSFVPNMFQTRYSGNDVPLSEYVLNHFHTIELHWPGLVILGFLANHYFYNVLDLLSFWADKTSRDKLLLNFRFIICFVLPIPHLVVVLSGSLHLDDTGKYLNLAFLNVMCLLVFVQAQVFKLSKTETFTPRSISVFALISYTNLTISAITGYGAGITIGKVVRIIAWSINFCMHCGFAFRYSRRVDMWKICFTSTYSLKERCVATSLFIPMICLIFIGTSNYIVRDIYDDRYHAALIPMYTVMAMLCCIPILIIPERNARLDLLRLKTKVESFNSTMTPEMYRMISSLDQLKNPSFLHAAFLEPSFRAKFSALVQACEGIKCNMMQINLEDDYTSSEASSRIHPGGSSSNVSVDNEPTFSGFEYRFMSNRQMNEEKLRHVRSRIERNFDEIEQDYNNDLFAVIEDDVNSSQRSSNLMRPGLNDNILGYGDYCMEMEDNSVSHENYEDTDQIITVNKKSKLEPLESFVSEEANNMNSSIVAPDESKGGDNHNAVNENESNEDGGCKNVLEVYNEVK